MTEPFRSRIRTALANANLQAALDANAERRTLARQQALAALPDAQALRQRAHAVRAEVIANLDRHLEYFVARAQRKGLVIHHAADAAQAVQAVLDIAASVRPGGPPLGGVDSHPPLLIAKSKTMLGEEIGLNPALEAAGMRVVETDLGEYIVQLRGEPPAHITTPAVHLRRGDVARLFHEKLGMPLTDDIPSMVATARQALRAVFLTADIGISGVNFGVAESGALCLLTNEGNGRMVSTLPRVHIALMGIERLVPRLDDLALMLALLPRSATGQKITSYVNLIHSPRRASDPDGPQERHLILIDNGRSTVRQSPLAEALYCIRCGACLNACPVFREIGGHAYASVYPGPIGAALSPALFGPEFGELARASSLCGACKDACPVMIDLPKLLLRVRAGQLPEHSGDPPEEHRPDAPRALELGLRLFSGIASNSRLFAAAQRLAAALGFLASPFTRWIHLPAFTGWGYSKDFPRPAGRPFRARWKAEMGRPEASSTSGPNRTADQSPNLPTAPPVSLVDQFAREWRALGGQLTLCSPDALDEVVVKLLTDKRPKWVATWADDQMPPDLLRRLRGRFRIAAMPEPGVTDGPTGVVGLTGALAAIAETGTLALPGGRGRPLSASLLPEVHIAILRASDIYQNLPQALRLREVQGASATALISGPSRTADIEMSLTIGMHGPKEVHVICVK